MMKLPQSIPAFLATGAATLASVLLATSASAQMAVKSTLLLDEHFQQYESYTKEPLSVKPGWRVRNSHAAWKRVPDGVQSVWTEGHMPVLVYEGSFGDAIIEVEFKFHQEKGKWVACRVSASNPELNPRAYATSVWANLDNPARPLGMVLEHDEWKPGVITTVDNKPATFDPDRWYTLRLEMIGDKVLATCNGVTVYGTHEKFGLPKTAVVLGTGLSPHYLRALRVYSATPNPQWTPPPVTPPSAAKPVDKAVAKSSS
jgi:hypothetical protein